jgi:serine phosphatase RsbU (regulator of sigma subunit)/CHASE2 domain-containing sensor protein
MRPGAPPGAGRPSRLRYGRLPGALLLAVMTLLSAAPGVAFLETLRYEWFDLCQRIAPRPRLHHPVVIVDVDAVSLARYGQWPWPRTLLARLVDRIAAAYPAAIGFDILMPESDRLSPQRLPELIPSIGEDLARRLSEMPSNDAVLAAALRDRPVVLAVVGVAGGAEAARTPVRAAPARILGDEPWPFLRRFAGSMRSLDEIDRSATGHGLVNVETDGGAVRRVPLVAVVGGVLVPALGLDMFRVAGGQREVKVAVGPNGINGVAVGDLAIRTQADGSVWLRYARPTPERFVSAAEVLAGQTAREVFERKLVVIGVTALGATDRRMIAGGRDVDGVEIQADLLESIYDNTLLMRPAWARRAESAFLLGGGALLILMVPAWRGRAIWVVGLPLLAAAVAGSLALFHWRYLLLDAAVPTLGLVVLLGTMLSVTLAELERQRRALRRQVESQREAAARLEGELSAARRIQMGILPKPADLLAGERRFSLEVVLEPAEEVGGDLYDFFMLDRRRLFFLIGDVSGSGVPGSLFMAVSKSLYKSTALRRHAAVAEMMREANAEISRDNPEALFVTVFAGVLDVDTGALEYCSAGHDPPYVLSRRGGPPVRVGDSNGPPLCVVEGFGYTASRRDLRPGDALCLFTDGVTEATNAAGELYGRGRLEALLAATPSGAGAAAVAAAIRDDVARFVAGAAPADDLAIMVLRWDGPGPR